MPEMVKSMNWDGRNIKRNEEIGVKHIYRVEAVKFYQLEMGSEEERKDDSCTSSNWEGDTINDHGIITWRADVILENVSLRCSFPGRY